MQAKAQEVSREEGQALARKHGCLFVETSAKANVAVNQAFEELVLRILDTPLLLDSSASSSSMPMRRSSTQTSSCCS